MGYRAFSWDHAPAHHRWPNQRIGAHYPASPAVGRGGFALRGRSRMAVAGPGRRSHGLRRPLLAQPYPGRRPDLERYRRLCTERGQGRQPVDRHLGRTSAPASAASPSGRAAARAGAFAGYVRQDGDCQRKRGRLERQSIDHLDGLTQLSRCPAHPHPLPAGGPGIGLGGNSGKNTALSSPGAGQLPLPGHGGGRSQRRGLPGGGNHVPHSAALVAEPAAATGIVPARRDWSGGCLAAAHSSSGRAKAAT